MAPEPASSSPSLTPLPAAMEAYTLWVRRNRDLVRSLESLANVNPRSRFPLCFPHDHFLLSVGPVSLVRRRFGDDVLAMLIDRGVSVCVSLGVR